MTQGVAAFSEALKVNTALTCLDFTGNHFIFLSFNDERSTMRVYLNGQITISTMTKQLF